MEKDRYFRWCWIFEEGSSELFLERSPRYGTKKAALAALALFREENSSKKYPVPGRGIIEEIIEHKVK